MCMLCFVVGMIVYILISAKITVNKEYKEWLHDQKEIRKHVTDNLHHEHIKN